MTTPFNTPPPSTVIVDNFLQDPLVWREFAMGHEFFLHKEYHKGMRTEERWLPDGWREEFERLIGRKITKWEEHGCNGVFQLCLAGDQIVYHSDYQNYAGLLYLTPDAPPQSGTATYRSKSTGWSKCPTEEEAKALGIPHEVAMQKLYSGKLLDSTAWDEVDVIGNVFNRLVLFESQTVHSARNYFGTNLEDGRLFQLFFFDIEK